MSKTVTELGIDWEMLRNQKEKIVAMISKDQRVHANNRDALKGIIHLLDAIQNEAAKELGEDAVFGMPDC